MVWSFHGRCTSLEEKKDWCSDLSNKSYGKVWDNNPLLHSQKGRKNIVSNLPENTKMLLWPNGLNSANLLFAKDNFHVGF